MKNKVIMTLMTLTLLLLASNVMAGVTVSITPTESAVPCVNRDTNFVIAVSGLAGSQIIHLETDLNLDVNGSQKARVAVNPTTGTWDGADGNITASAAGLATIQLDYVNTTQPIGGTRS